MNSTRRKNKLLGRYIVADPAICHGQPTFRGTRILVADVLEQVASGMAWEAIIEEWRGALTKGLCSPMAKPSITPSLVGDLKE